MNLSLLRIVQRLLVSALMCASSVYGVAEQPGVAHGTINVFLANQNGIVVLTDSRLTYTSSMLALPDPAQKLFVLDTRTVVAFAGFASEALRMDPEVPNATSEIIQSYAYELYSKGENYHPSLKQKLGGLAWILKNQLELITTISNSPHEKDYALELTMAGYDVDGLAKIDWVDLGLGQAAPYHKVSVGEFHEQVIGLELTSCIRGIPDVALDILEHPIRYRSIRLSPDTRRPSDMAAIKGLPEHSHLATPILRLLSLQRFTVDEMKALADASPPNS